MVQLSDNLIIFRSRVSEEHKKEVVTNYNGREISENEQEIITEAAHLARIRESSMLSGLLR